MSVELCTQWDVFSRFGCHRESCVQFATVGPIILNSSSQVKISVPPTVKFEMINSPLATGEGTVHLTVWKNLIV